MYNNSSTIRHVLSVLSKNKNLAEVVIIDDASKDDSARIIEDFVKGKPNVIFLRNRKNLGKGGAVVRALRHTKYDIVFLCDADLAKLKHQHVNAIVETFRTGKYDMVIANREDDFEDCHVVGKFFATVSGERIFRKKVIEPYYDLISGLGNGLEQVTNFAHRDKDVKIITNRDIGHIVKYQRGNPAEWTKEYVKEGYQLLKTDLKLKRRVLPGVALSALVGTLFTLWYFSTRHNGKKTR